MSVRVVGQVTLREGETPESSQGVADRLGAVGLELTGALASHAGVHFDLSVGGGDLTWDLLLDGEEALAELCRRLAGTGPEGMLGVLGGRLAELASQVASVELAVPETLDTGLGSPGLVGVKRTLWLRVLPEAEAGQVARFEAETPLLAEAVPAIRNWRWSRVRALSPRPMALRWTHLWEQEFDSVDGLQVDYMSSPCHWGYIDRWFDLEMPDRVVDLWLAHLACPEQAPVLSWDSRH
jgi:hypothetical protein